MKKPCECSHHVFRECCWNYRDTMSPSSIDQGRKCNWPTPSAAAWREPHRKSKLDMRVDYIAFTKPWIEKLKDSTQRDPILAMVYQLTQQGWPHQRRQVPCLARRYWGLQRRTINRWWNAPERTEVSHTGGTSRGVFKPSTWRPSLSNQGTGECKTTYVLDWNRCGHWRLHQAMPGMYQKVSGTQGAPPGLMTFQRALGGNLVLIISPSMATHMSWSVIISRNFPFFTEPKHHSGH